MNPHDAIQIADHLLDAAADLIEPGEPPHPEYTRGIEDLILRLHGIPGELRDVIHEEIQARIGA